MQVQGVLKLCYIGATLVAQWWIGIHNTIITQILQCHLILGLPQPVKIPASDMHQRLMLGIDETPVL